MCALGLCSAGTYAVPILISDGNPGNAGTDNVLFNNDALVRQGPVVQGDFNGAGLGYIIEFTSDSGTGGLQGAGGQAEIEGLVGNNPIMSLTFGLTDNATFTSAIFNIDADADGFMTVAVDFLGGAGSPYEELVPLNDNGQNFYHVFALEGNVISSITLSTIDSGFNVARQFRIGGFADASNGTNVPDGGATAVMLGLGMLGLVGIGRTKRQ
jgi:hypothetical protein